MTNLDIKNVSIDVTPYNSNKEYCILTLSADIDDRTHTESIAVFSKFVFEQPEDHRSVLLKDIIQKLSYDMLLKSVTGFNKQVESNIDITNCLKKMENINSPENSS